jgi:hypothetical protein
MAGRRPTAAARSIRAGAEALAAALLVAPSIAFAQQGASAAGAARLDAAAGTDAASGDLEPAAESRAWDERDFTDFALAASAGRLGAAADEGFALAEQATAPAAAEESRWSDFLPLMKEEAVARGYQLPLPFGSGATFTVLLNRDIEVTDLRIGVNGGPKQSVSRFVDLGSKSDVFNANVKLDAWILPFLNVYVLLGYVYNESDTRVAVSVPKPGPIPGTYDFDLKVDTKLDGFVGGGGITLAGGYHDFFMVIDSNITQTDIGFDDRFRAIVASLRAGYQGRIGDLSAQFWLGGSYWDTANTAKGHADVPGVGRVDFEADQGPSYPWVVDIGTNVRIARSFEAFADVGFDLHGGMVFTVGPVFRF